MTYRARHCLTLGFPVSQLMGVMKRLFGLAVILIFAVTQVHSQSVTFDFEDGTDQGFGTGFGNDASASFSIQNVAGSLRMYVPRTGAFQEAGVGHGADGSPFYLAMQGAAANEAGYNISSDWYVDTSTFGAGAGTFLQIGTFVNSGSGYYAQDFGAPNEAQLSGAQLASGQVFSGTVTINMAAVGYDMPATDTFFRLGLIENGNGAAQAVYFDNIRVTAVPEPASAALLGLGASALMFRARRKGRC
jgi:hypothetical protein